MEGSKKRRSVEELRALLETMRAADDKITVDTFIKEAGGGDRTFMSEFLAEWRKEVKEREENALADLPEAARGMLKLCDLQLKEILGMEEKRARDRFSIIEEELRVRAAAAAAQARKTIESLEVERADLQEQLSATETAFDEERQRGAEIRLQNERLARRVEDMEAAAVRERESMHGLLTRQDRDLLDSREQVRRESERRAAAVEECTLLKATLADRDAELQRSREALLRLEEREATLRQEYEEAVAGRQELDRVLADVRVELEEERAASRQRELALAELQAELDAERPGHSQTSQPKKR
jgi:hypothetical protein